MVYKTKIHRTKTEVPATVEILCLSTLWTSEVSRSHICIYQTKKMKDDEDTQYPFPSPCPNMCPDSLGFKKSRNKLPCPSLCTHTAPHESLTEKSGTVDCPSALGSEHLYFSLLRSRWGKRYSPQIFSGEVLLWDWLHGTFEGFGQLELESIVENLCPEPHL